VVEHPFDSVGVLHPQDMVRKFTSRYKKAQGGKIGAAWFAPEGSRAAHCQNLKLLAQ